MATLLGVEGPTGGDEGEADGDEEAPDKATSPICDRLPPTCSKEGFATPGLKEKRFAPPEYGKIESTYPRVALAKRR
jgi:hypothetical protein